MAQIGHTSYLFRFSSLLIVVRSLLYTQLNETTNKGRTMEMQLIGNKGTAKMYKIAGAASHIEDAPYTGFSARAEGDDLIITTGKCELFSVQTWVKSLTNKTEVAAQKPSTTNERRIQLLSIAEEKGEKHGKSWRASGLDVDRKSLNPAWEGELICYVYSN